MDPVVVQDRVDGPAHSDGRHGHGGHVHAARHQLDRPLRVPLGSPGQGIGPDGEVEGKAAPGSEATLFAEEPFFALS